MKIKNKRIPNRLKPLRSVFVATVCFYAINSQANDKFEQQWQQIEQQYHQQLKQQQVVGSATRFIHQGKTVKSSYYGLADKQKGYRVDEHTLFHWASITKTLTGIAIMQLEERGLLSLADPIVKYLPELNAVHNPYGEMSDISILDVMSHSSGFRASSFPWKRKAWHPHEPTKWSQLVAMMPYTEVTFEPGTKFSYSNLAIIFLGQIIEQLTGDDIEVYIDKNIFKPLQMYSAYFDATPYHLLKHRSNNYYADEGQWVEGKPDFDTGITTANGGLNASMNDMSKYAAFLLGDPNKADVYEQVLSRKSLNKMWQKRFATARKGRPDEGMGLTFFTRQPAQTQFALHTGSQMSFTSFLMIDPQNKTAAITVLNTQIWNKDQNGKYQDKTRQVFNYMQEQYFKIMPDYQP